MKVREADADRKMPVGEGRVLGDGGKVKVTVKRGCGRGGMTDQPETTALIWNLLYARHYPTSLSMTH